ncbi:MAG TPA: hypothetical protein VH374_20980 [Polyangia bacterium]|nr:hypothetical protein [Polyangia bacterium]
MTGLRTRGVWLMGALVLMAAATAPAPLHARSLAQATAPAAPSADDRPRVTFLGTDVAGGAASDGRAFDEAVVKGLQRTDIAFVAIDSGKIPHTAEGLICAGPSCLARAAAATGARYFVRAEARAQPTPGAPSPSSSSSYTAKVQVFRVHPFETVASGDFACDACSTEAVAQKFEQRATDAMAKALAAGAGGDSQPTLTVAVDNEGSSNGGRVGPWIVGGAGVALVGAGVFLVARGDQSACPGVPASACGQTYSDARTGWLLSGVGLAAIGGAIAWGWVGPREHAPNTGPLVSLFSVGPNSVTVGGEF